MSEIRQWKNSCVLIDKYRYIDNLVCRNHPIVTIISWLLN